MGVYLAMKELLFAFTAPRRLEFILYGCRIEDVPLLGAALKADYVLVECFSAGGGTDERCERVHGWLGRDSLDKLSKFEKHFTMLADVLTDALVTMSGLSGIGGGVPRCAWSSAAP